MFIQDVSHRLIKILTFFRKCESCEFKATCEKELKRHKRDNHDMITFSISPKSKIQKFSEVTKDKNHVDGQLKKQEKVNLSLEDMEVDATNDKEKTPREITNLKFEKCPNFIEPFVSKDTVLFKSIPDGACAFNSAAYFLYEDENMGVKLRNLVNKNIVDNFETYQNKISFPYQRKVGSHKIVKFDEKQKDDYKKFLLSLESSKLWADCEDLCSLADIFDLVIKIITVNDNSEEVKVSFICPDNTKLKKTQIDKTLQPTC